MFQSVPQSSVRAARSRDAVPQQHRRQQRWAPKASAEEGIAPTEAVTVPPAVSSAMPTPASDMCHAMARTELHGDVVKWGADHILADAAACCEACRVLSTRGGKQNCTVWVFCDQPACGAQRGQCWLKHLADPYTDIDLVMGRSDRWTAGALEPPPVGMARMRLGLGCGSD